MEERRVAWGKADRAMAGEHAVVRLGPGGDFSVDYQDAAEGGAGDVRGFGWRGWLGLRRVEAPLERPFRTRLPSGRAERPERWGLEAPPWRGADRWPANQWPDGGKGGAGAAWRPVLGGSGFGGAGLGLRLGARLGAMAALDAQRDRKGGVWGTVRGAE